MSPLQVQSKFSLFGSGLHWECSGLLRPDTWSPAEPHQQLQGHPQFCDADGLFCWQHLRPGRDREQAHRPCSERTCLSHMLAGCMMTNPLLSWIRYPQVLINDSCTKCHLGSRSQSSPILIGLPGPRGQGESLNVKTHILYHQWICWKKQWWMSRSFCIQCPWGWGHRNLVPQHWESRRHLCLCVPLRP